MPTVIPVSAAGHDRLFGVTYDTAGNFYAVGVLADSTEATADFRTQVLKFSASGQRDMSFGTNGVASHNIAVGTNGEATRGIVVQASGKIVALATVEHAGAMDPRDRDLALVRFNANGTLDTTFGTNGVVTLDLSDGAVNGTAYVADSAWGLTAYSDGRLLVTGSQRRMGAMDTDFAVVRLSVDGVRDAAFGTNGVATVDISNRSASPRNATILADNSVVMAGYMDDGGVVKPVLFKLTPAGVLDTTFGVGGVFYQTVLPAATEVYAAGLRGTSFVTAGYGRGAAADGGVAPENDVISLRVSAAGVLDTTYGKRGGGWGPPIRGFSDQARDGGGGAGGGTGGPHAHDLGGVGDAFWGVALNPARTQAAIVGARGVATPAADAGVSTDNDDGVVYLLTL